jgi:hypothetical protein
LEKCFKKTEDIQLVSRMPVLMLWMRDEGGVGEREREVPRRGARMEASGKAKIHAKKGDPSCYKLSDFCCCWQNPRSPPTTPYTYTLSKVYTLPQVLLSRCYLLHIS